MSGRAEALATAYIILSKAASQLLRRGVRFLFRCFLCFKKNGQDLGVNAFRISPEPLLQGLGHILPSDQKIQFHKMIQFIAEGKGHRIAPLLPGLDLCLDQRAALEALIVVPLPKV